MTNNPHRTHRPHGSPQHAEWRSRVRAHADPVEPWQVVERRRSGLLRYARARGTMALPVQYATWEHRVYLRLPEYNDACHFVDRADIALDVDASTVGRVLIARVRGLGLLIPESALPDGLGAALDGWPEEVPTRALVLVPESVRRIPMADDVRYPPLPYAGARLPGTFADA